MEPLGFYTCVVDIEDELILALGTAAFKSGVAYQGDLVFFRPCQMPPAQERRPSSRSWRTRVTSFPSGLSRSSRPSSNEAPINSSVVSWVPGRNARGSTPGCWSTPWILPRCRDPSTVCWHTCQVSDLRMTMVPSGWEIPIATACDSESALDSVTMTGGCVTPVKVPAPTRVPSARSSHTLYCCPGMKPRARKWISVPHVMFSNVATPWTVSLVNETRVADAGRGVDMVVVTTKMPTSTAADAVTIAHVRRRRRPRLAARRDVIWL